MHTSVFILIINAIYNLSSFAVPVITVNISSSTQYLLDVPPYNRFMGSCVANVSVDGLEGPVELAIEWQWWRKGEGESELSKLPDNNFTNNESMSTLSYHEVINGSVMYWCVSILKGVDNISNYDNITVSVVGELQITTACILLQAHYIHRLQSTQHTRRCSGYRDIFIQCHHPMDSAVNCIYTRDLRAGIWYQK